MKLKDAVKENFARCTRNEMRGFCREANIKIGPAAGPDLMRKELMAHHKLTENQHVSMKVDKVIKYRARNEILPPYNLTPEGTWGGRRRRIRLGKSLDSTKSQKAELVSWNCKNPYRVPFNEVEAVPEPIYNLLREKERAVAVSKSNEQTGEVYTDWVMEPRFNVDDMGVDPDTAHLAGSLREWYQGRGPSWLRERTLVELNHIADHCQIERSMYRGADAGKARSMTLEELRGTLMVQFFDNPDVEESDEDEPPAHKMPQEADA